MPWCPTCRSEYREGFTICANCQVELVPELPPEIPLDAEGVEEAIEAGVAVVVARGGLDSASRMRDVLGDRRVPAVIIGDPETETRQGAYSVYDVVVHPDAVEAARAALASDFQSMLVAEGLDADASGATIDLEAGGEVTCPACATVFTVGESAECPECGLNLGMPEQ